MYDISSMDKRGGHTGSDFGQTERESDATPRQSHRPHASTKNEVEEEYKYYIDLSKPLLKLSKSVSQHAVLMGILDAFWLRTSRAAYMHA